MLTGAAALGAFLTHLEVLCAAMHDFLMFGAAAK